MVTRSVFFVRIFCSEQFWTLNGHGFLLSSQNILYYCQRFGRSTAKPAVGHCCCLQQPPVMVRVLAPVGSSPGPLCISVAGLLLLLVLPPASVLMRTFRLYCRCRRCSTSVACTHHHELIVDNFIRKNYNDSDSFLI